MKVDFDLIKNETAGGKRLVLWKCNQRDVYIFDILKEKDNPEQAIYLPTANNLMTADSYIAFELYDKSLAQYSHTKYHVIIYKNDIMRHVGQASSIEELMDMLNPDERKAIYDNEAYKDLSKFFDASYRLQKETILTTAGSLTINLISNGEELTCMVLYM